MKPQTAADTRHERVLKHKAYIFKLCEIIFKARAINTATLTDEQLKAMSVCVLDQLDVDDDAPIEFGPRYFVPLQAEKLDDYCNDTYRRVADSQWERLCQGEDEINLPQKTCRIQPGCLPFTDACGRALWLMEMFAPWSSSLTSLASRTGWDHLASDFEPGVCSGFTNGGDQYDGGMHYIATEPNVPHSSALVKDAHVAGSATLLSEIIAAAQLLKKQIRRVEFLNHHTLPILVISLQHDCAARITQMHFDGEHLFLRPSRTLDLASDKPTPDAYKLVCWLANKHVGETAYVENPASTLDEPGKPVPSSHDVPKNTVQVPA